MLAASPSREESVLDIFHSGSNASLAFLETCFGNSRQHTSDQIARILQKIVRSCIPVWCFFKKINV
jgi:hypothetical protein